jgi:plasmid segregation protein ParM
MNHDKIVRALDVGYGNVKFVRSHKSLEAKVICDMFPSRSPAASESTIGEGTLKKRDTVVVNVNGTNYEVGHDVIQAQGANDISSILDNKFVRSDGYMARVLGALHYMFTDIEQDYIDLLVVGLPVNNIKEHKEFLIGKLKGKHEIPFGRVIEIKEVRVFEQPLGAFFNFMYSPDEPENFSYNDVKNQRNLIIDPGMYTFDWLLVDSMKASDNRSGGTARAMSDVIKAMAKVIAKEQKTTTEQVFKIIDDAIRSNRQPRIFSNEINLEDYIQHAKTVVNESVDALANSVGDGADVDNIMLVGGGARFFLESIKNKFPRHKIITTDNSVFANVIGFQMAGERYFLRDQVNARKTVLTA